MKFKVESLKSDLLKMGKELDKKRGRFFSTIGWSAWQNKNTKNLLIKTKHSKNIFKSYNNDTNSYHNRSYNNNISNKSKNQLKGPQSNHKKYKNCKYARYESEMKIAILIRIWRLYRQ